MSERVFTDEQCFRLNAEQQRRDRHPYTCGNDSRHRNLIATPQGWRCADCDYTQGWAHESDKRPEPITAEALRERGYREGIRQWPYLDIAPQLRLAVGNPNGECEVYVNGHPLRRVRDLADLDRLVAALRGDE